jgi:hypothetical protein
VSEIPTQDATDGDRIFAGVAQVIGFPPRIGEVDGTISRRCSADDYFRAWSGVPRRKGS